VSEYEMLATAARSAAAAFRELGAAMQAGFDRDLAQHPDVAELNVQLDAFYGPIS
jgi:hypothetical protein